MGKSTLIYAPRTKNQQEGSECGSGGGKIWFHYNRTGKKDGRVGGPEIGTGMGQGVLVSWIAIEILELNIIYTINGTTIIS